MIVAQNPKEFANELTRALSLDLPYYDRPQNLKGTRAAVVALFAFNDQGKEPALLFIRRTETVETHKGQIAFPGGHTDLEDASSRETALRELSEEVGILADQVQLCGSLPDLWTITNYWISPWVGILKLSRTRINLKNLPSEIAESFWVPLSILQDPSVYHEEQWTQGRVSHPIHVFDVEGHRIWGATGAMVKNLLDRISKLG